MNLFMREVDYSNFFNNTETVFKGCKTPSREPDFVSESGSRYWYGQNSTGNYVIRQSDHWCVRKSPKKKHQERKRISSCRWHIKNIKDCKKLTGKAYLKNFVVI